METTQPFTWNARRAQSAWWLRVTLFQKASLGPKVPCTYCKLYCKKWQVELLATSHLSL